MGLQPIFEQLYFFNENSITSVIIELSLTFGVNRPETRSLNTLCVTSLLGAPSSI